MEPILTKEEIVELYGREDERGQRLLRYIFGLETFVKRPIGVWCATISLKRVITLTPRSAWNDSYRQAIMGVAVVSGDTAVFIAPHNTIVAQWGPDGIDNSEFITDVESINVLDANDRIISRCSGIKQDDLPEPYRMQGFIGAPAAYFCRHYLCYDSDTMVWVLPTIVQLRSIAKNIAEINECFLTMGLPPMIRGWYWSSIAVEGCKTHAWMLHLDDNKESEYFKCGVNLVRAVHPFDISVVCFTHPSSAE